MRHSSHHHSSQRGGLGNDSGSLVSRPLADTIAVQQWAQNIRTALSEKRYQDANAYSWNILQTVGYRDLQALKEVSPQQFVESVPEKDRPACAAALMQISHHHVQSRDTNHLAAVLLLELAAAVDPLNLKATAYFSELCAEVSVQRLEAYSRDPQKNWPIDDLAAEMLREYAAGAQAITRSLAVAHALGPDHLEGRRQFSPPSGDNERRQIFWCIENFARIQVNWGRHLQDKGDPAAETHFQSAALGALLSLQMVGLPRSADRLTHALFKKYCGRENAFGTYTRNVANALSTLGSVRELRAIELKHKRGAAEQSPAAEFREAMIYYWLSRQIDPNINFVKARLDELHARNRPFSPEEELKSRFERPSGEDREVVIRNWEEWQTKLDPGSLPDNILKKSGEIAPALRLGPDAVDVLTRFARDLLLYRSDKSAATKLVLQSIERHMDDWWEKSAASREGLVAFRAMGWFLTDITKHHPELAGKAKSLLEKQEEITSCSLSALELNEAEVPAIDEQLSLFTEYVLRRQ